MRQGHGGVKLTRVIVLLTATSLFLLLASTPTAFAKEDEFHPYQILGVHRRASAQDIRKAYKALAREWHPDKWPDEAEKATAEKKFIKINRAYELLSDPDRRRQFDNHGVTEDKPNFRKNPRDDVYSSYGRFDHPFDSFHEFFGGGGGGGGGGFKFRFNAGGGGGDGGPGKTVFHKQTITSKAYYNTVLPNSAKQPYLLLFYSDWCFTCLRIEPIWTRLTEELEPIGFGIATVHTEHEKELARKISVKELPHFILLLDGKAIHYKDPQFSAVKMLEFVRRKLPYKMVEKVNDDNVDDFLNGWMDNKIRVLLFGKLDIVRLRYLTTAYKYRQRAVFGYVQINGESEEVVRRFGVAGNADSVLLFNEDTEKPVTKLSMKDIPISTLNEVIDANQFLQLPRLSSQPVFDALCPPETAKSRRRLCVVLVNAGGLSGAGISGNSGGVGGSGSGSGASGDASDEDGKRQALREFVSDFKFSRERVRFTYVLQDKQADFVKSLVSGSEVDLKEKNLAIVWRREPHSVRYEWLEEHWPSAFDLEQAEQLNATRQMLKKTLQMHLSASTSGGAGGLLSHEAVVKELIDEHATTLFVRIVNRMFEALELIRENVTKDELLPALSLVVTVGFVIAGGYVMNYLVKMEEESVRKQLGAKGLKVDKKGKVVPELKIHELRAETYNGMVRLLKPGCRTVVLIVDRESKEKLVPKFYKLAWPYRRNKTLMFGFLYIEKGLPWFKKILNLTLPEPRDININPKNCIGTVLSLNGHRRYFCMYHAKHPEGSRRKIYTANNGAAAGAFMGFDSELEDSGGSDNERDVEGCAPPAAGAEAAGQSKLSGGGGLAGAAAASLLDPHDHLPIFEDQLLDGLQMWLDRLFEGSTYRYHINYWPEFPISPANFSRTTSS